MTKQLPDDVNAEQILEDAKAAGLPIRSHIDGSNPKIWITKEGDYTHRILKFCQLQRQRERDTRPTPQADEVNRLEEALMKCKAIVKNAEHDYYQTDKALSEIDIYIQIREVVDAALSHKEQT